jgi:hypothetical protein
MPGMRHLATALLLGLPLVVGPATSALAAPPDRSSFAVDDTGLSRTSEDCGFDILVHVEGTIRVVDFLDGDGTNVRTLVTYPSLTYTFSNAETGESVTSRSPDPEHLTWNPDGSLSVTVTGLVMHWTVPGDGVVAAQSGRLTFTVDAEGHESGAEPVGRNDDYHAALCEILAP